MEFLATIKSGFDYIVAGAKRVFGMQKRITELEEKIKRLEEEKGYKVIAYWDESDNIFDDVANFRNIFKKRYPRIIYSEKHGMQEVPYPLDDKNIRR